MFEIRTNDEHLTSVKVDSRRQLQRNLDDPTQKTPLGFLVYDSKRQVYITGEYDRRNGPTEVLWVQERATGRRLQPVKGPLPILVFFSLANAVLSRDCKYLAILYHPFAASSPTEFITTIWVIEDSLDFHDLRSRRPWARQLNCFMTQKLGFIHGLSRSCLPLTVGRDGLFYCPIGQIHPEFGIQKQLPLATVNNGYPSDEQPVYALAGDGQTLIKLDRVKGLVEKISWLEDTVTKTWQFPIPASYAQQEGVYLKAISRTARFMVYEIGYRAFYLFHYQRNLEQLQVQNSSPYKNVKFYFTQDEQYLLGICATGLGKE